MEFHEWPRMAQDYLTEMVFWPIAAPVAAFFALMPIVHAATGKKNRHFGPQHVLQTNILLMIVGYVLLTGLGVTMREYAPDAHDALTTYQPNTLDIVDFAFLFLQSLPIAFGVTSSLYGLFGGGRKLALGVLGFAATAPLALANFVAAAFAACTGWGQCL